MVRRFGPNLGQKYNLQGRDEPSLKPEHRESSSRQGEQRTVGEYGLDEWRTVQELSSKQIIGITSGDEEIIASAS